MSWRNVYVWQIELEPCCLFKKQEEQQRNYGRQLLFPISWMTSVTDKMVKVTFFVHICCVHCRNILQILFCEYILLISTSCIENKHNRCY